MPARRKMPYTQWVDVRFLWWRKDETAFCCTTNDEDRHWIQMIHVVDINIDPVLWKRGDTIKIRLPQWLLEKEGMC